MLAGCIIDTSQSRGNQDECATHHMHCVLSGFESLMSTRRFNVFDASASFEASKSDVSHYRGHTGS